MTNAQSPGIRNSQTDERYMRRCLQLALKGRQFVSPNPMVGAVIVYNGKIIGEGFHREYGKPHAEVNAINSVNNKELLKQSTIYVSLEPCSHYGKTPPCSQLIIDHKIPRVVVATLDPYHEVSGRGVRMLRDAGVEVTIGVLEDDARYLNREFFTSQIQHRPYIYLKWAQTEDGFIDKERKDTDIAQPTPISNNLTKILVHKRRTEIAGIMIGTNTAIKDNPLLSSRLWYGRNPIRIVLDRNCRIPKDYHLFSGAQTLLFTQSIYEEKTEGQNIFIPLTFDENMLQSVLKELNKRKINSILVEGGSALLQSFIDKGLWDEAYIEISDITFNSGIKAPLIGGKVVEETKTGRSKMLLLKNN